MALGCFTPVPRENLPQQSLSQTATALSQPPAAPNPTSAAASPLPMTPSAPRATASPGGGATATATASAADMLQVLGPEDGARIQADVVVVHGFAAIDAQVKVNGQSAAIDEEGRFSREAPLSPGVNAIQVSAESPDGSRAAETLTVISLMLPPQPFFLLITQPESQTVVSRPDLPIIGRTTPGAAVSVNGVSVPVDVSGVFTTTVALEPGANVIDVVGSDDGETAHEAIAVIYRP